MSKKKFVIISGILLICGLVAGSGFRMFCSPEEAAVLNVPVSYAFDAANPNKLVGWSDNVFVGRVEIQTGTRHLGSTVPWSTFEVRVVKKIKGELGDVVTVAQEGGFSIEENAYMLLNDDALLEAGREYLFVTKADVEKGWHVLVPVFGNLPIKNSREFREVTARFENAYQNQVQYDPSSLQGEGRRQQH